MCRHDNYEEMFNTIKAFQREVYEIMFRKGWDEFENAETNKIVQKYNTLNQEYTDLNI